MSLDEIKALLAVRDAPEASCDAVNALLTHRIGHVAERLAELAALQAELLALSERCTVPQRAGECGILEGLGQASPGPVMRAPYQAGSHGAGKVPR
jgi:hypothetical protein